jgi:hypothetical protein
MRVEMQSRNRSATLKKSLHATETRWLWLNYAFIDPKAKRSLSENQLFPWTIAAGRFLQRRQRQPKEGRHRIRTGSKAPHVLSQLFEELGMRVEALG